MIKNLSKSARYIMHNSFSAYVLPCTSRERFGSVSPSLAKIFPSRRFSDALIAFYTLRCTWKSHTPTVVQGGRGWWNPCPSSFLICCSNSKRFCFQWKTFDLLDKMRYTLWMVALLEACNVTKHGCHLGPHLWFYQKVEIKQERRENDFFFLVHDV